MTLFREYAKNLLFSFGSTHLGKIIGKSFRGKGAILCYHRVVKNETYNKEESPQKNLRFTRWNRVKTKRKKTPAKHINFT